MKKLFLTIAAFGLLVFNSPAQTGQGEGNQTQGQQPGQEDQNWESSDDNRWRGADNVWYRKEGENILKSEDGTNWQRVEDNRFQTYDGTWYQYQDGELKKSRDGMNWEEAEDWSDQDGRSFRFGDQGQLESRGGQPGDIRGQRDENRKGVTGEEGEEDELIKGQKGREPGK